MLSKEKKIEITEQIVASNTLKNAPTSIAILRFLVQANIDDRPLKESIIDIEFFGGEVDAEKSNPRVRVNVYNLRKKLNAYYAVEGVQDEWKVVIDKGQYSVRFVLQNQKAIKKPRFEKKQAIPYLLFFVTAIILLFQFLPSPKPKLWKGFFTNNQSNHLYIGDAFGYGGKTISGLSGWTRDFSINSTDEYYALIEKQPQLKNNTSITDFFYSTRMAENATHSLSRYFTKWKADFEIRYATRTSFADIKEGNTIYVGRLKDQKDFIYLFNEANPYFQINNNRVVFSNHVSLPDTSFATVDGTTETDYALVSRIQGPNNTEQFLFFSNHDIGVMATVEIFTNQDSISAFTKKYLRKSPYFTALYKVRGKERINLDLEEVIVVPFD